MIHEFILQGVEGILALVDFEKAFDTLDWAFIHKMFVLWGFG